MNALAAGKMPIATNADLWPVIVAGLGETPRPREKLAPDGRGTFTTGTVALMTGPDGTTRAQKSASVHVIEAAADGYGLGVTYVAQGAVWVQPYTPDGGRSTLSITVERLVPVGTASGKRGE